MALLQTQAELMTRLLSANDPADAIVQEISDMVRVKTATPPETAEIPMARDTERMLLSAVKEASNSANQSVQPIHLLLAMAADASSGAAEILKAHSITESDVRTYMQK